MVNQATIPATCQGSIQGNRLAQLKRIIQNNRQSRL